MTRISFIVLAAFAIAGCRLPDPYQVPAPQQPEPGPGSAQTQPVPPTTSPAPTQPSTPAPPREPVLSPASRALVAQSQSQLASKNYPLAAASIERALRIEPGNGLLWVELGKVRMAEGNYQQAENFGRKAIALTGNAPNAQSTAWRLVADAYRARGKTNEAHDADVRAAALTRG
jgi:Flp pilus assembly protein TadD